MRKILLTFVAVASLAAATVASPTDAEARCRGCWVGGGIAAGVIAGAAIANAGYYGGYAPAYYGGYAPAYYGYRPYYAPRYGYYAPRYYAPRYYAPRYYGYGYGYRPYRYGYRW